jgi:tryptophan synthase alpha chain
VTDLLAALQSRRNGGRKLLIPYVMGGTPDPESFPDALRAVTAHADAVEVGLPYSDPLMDGPVIAAAGERALRSGLGPLDALELASDVGVPRIAMTYFNPVFHLGEEAFCARAAAAGYSGLIVPDVPVEESGALTSAAATEGLAWIPLVAPTSPPERVERIVAGATGFVYAVSTLGVTGPRRELSQRARSVVEACRPHTDVPVLVGVGVSDPGQAAEAVRWADGVVMGSAVVKLLLERGAEAAGALLAEVRAALDGV